MREVGPKSSGSILVATKAAEALSPAAARALEMATLEHWGEN